ncbi:M23 family metallopeptidase [Streptomyces sp. NPDC056600]|uniref:M23 family metallopeptidase n=1 Tax=Streptomyces sp. NPDC056600 TaxID=3345874 RepID=UPI0036B5AC44
MDERHSSAETTPQANGASGEPWTDGARGAPYDAYAAQYFAETEGRFAGHDTGTFAGGAYGTGAYGTGTYGTGAHPTGAFATGGYDTGAAGTGAYATGFWDTGSFDAGSWDTGSFGAGSWDTGSADTGSWDTGSWDTAGSGGGDPGADGASTASVPEQRTGDHDAQDALAASTLAPPHAGSRRRRRAPVRRSALLRVAVPSACVMGVTAAAMASVSTDGSTDASAASGSDPRPVKPSYEDEFAAQLGGITAAANDFGGRASREQEREDLAERRQAEMKKAAQEAAKKERLRPKFVSPVDRRGLSAYYGAAGSRWARGHTGIDFPVSYGTPVFAVTDGVVSHKVNSALGNMVIVTAKDGTETWYCHLASWKLTPGAVVKAGDTIAYSGDTGNSSGPHLHLEVHSGGGGAIDPLAWLISHGVDPA